MVPKPCDVQQSVRLRSCPRGDTAAMAVRKDSGTDSTGLHHPQPQLSDVATAKSEALLQSSSEASATTMSLSSTNPLSSNLWWIHGKGYNLEEFVSRHPGGVEAILLGKGRDCTAMVESYHPFGSQHWKVLEKHLVIEDLQHRQGQQHMLHAGKGNQQQIKTAHYEHDFFYEILKERVSAALFQKGIDPKEDRGATTQRALYYLVVFLSWMYTGYMHLSVRCLSKGGSR
jgi:cytochrome b involved in lipid metabolism